jgi:hypothetical protein
MPNLKNVIVAGSIDSVFHGVFKQLEKDRYAILQTNDRKKQLSFSTSFSMTYKDFIDRGLLLPPMHHDKKQGISVIGLPKNVKIREVRGNKSSFFHIEKL